jgi:AcrR family transcriptional regulator
MSPGAEESIWTRPEPGARGAAHTRAEIAAAAIAIADRDGVKAVSMRRVAAEIGAGTMTLYHYVRNKDELMALVGDAIMGELLIPDGEMPADWRAALTEIAVRTRDALIRHPWMFDLPGKGGEGGPNGTKHVEQSLATVAAAGFDRIAGLEVVAMVDDYVFGFAMRANAIRRGVGDEPAAVVDELADRLGSQVDALDPDEFPNIHDLFGNRDAREVLMTLISTADDDERFNRGLDLILDGVERRIGV